MARERPTEREARRGFAQHEAPIEVRSDSDLREKSTSASGPETASESSQRDGAVIDHPDPLILDIRYPIEVAVELGDSHEYQIGEIREPIRESEIGTVESHRDNDVPGPAIVGEELESDPQPVEIGRVEEAISSVPQESLGESDPSDRVDGQRELGVSDAGLDDSSRHSDG